MLKFRIDNLLQEKAAREQKIILPSHAAKAIGIHHDTFINYMNNNRAFVKLEYVKRIADYFGVPIEELLEEVDEESELVAV